MSFEKRAYHNAINWVNEAAAIVKRISESNIEVRVKMNHSDLVTIVDQEVETFFVEQIKSHYPDHNIIGEENINNTTSDSDYKWIIDPIDGTTNLINRQQDYAISVAFCKGEQGIFGIVYDVAKDRLFYSFSGEGAYLNGKKLSGLLEADSTLSNELLAMTLPWNEMKEIDSWGIYLKLASRARGIRVYGATTIELCEIAVGKLGAYVHHNINTWDYAASRVILEELGCKFTDLEGDEIAWTYNGGLVVSVPKIQEEIVTYLKKFQNIIIKEVDAE